MNYSNSRLAWTVGLALAFVASAQANDDDSGSRRAALRLLQEGKVADAEVILRKLGAEGDDSAEIALGAILKSTGRVLEAIDVLTPLANRGMAEAEWQLSRVYLDKSPPDVKLADHWRTKAAADGNVDARLASMPIPDLGVDAQGRIRTAAFVAVVKERQRAKVDTMNEATLACYGSSRETLQTAIDQAANACAKGLPQDQRERLKLTADIRDRFSSCVLMGSLQRIGKTLDDVARCFGD